MTPWEMANLDPRGMVGRINVEDHQTLLHTKSVSSWPHGFIEDFWRFFSWRVLYKHMTPGAPGDYCKDKSKKINPLGSIILFPSKLLA